MIIYKITNIDTGEIFNSMKDAANKYQTDPSNISKCVHGHILTTKGFRWILCENS